MGMGELYIRRALFCYVTSGVESTRARLCLEVPEFGTDGGLAGAWGRSRIGDMDRVIKTSVVTGKFAFPIGIKMLDTIEPRGTVTVSTVCLEEAHFEDPLDIVSVEHGYETMVFIDGCTLFSVFTESYQTKKEAEAGHDITVKRLYERTLPLAISLYYFAWDHSDSANVPAASNAEPAGGKP